MSKPSNWPLSKKSSRTVAPVVIRKELQIHPLTKDCYPLAIGHYESAYNHQMSRKKHDDNLLIYCLSGKGYLTTSAWSGDINPGDIALLPKGVNHRYHADALTPWSIYWCHFSGHQSQDYLYHMDYLKEKPVQFIGDSPQLKAQFQAVLAETSTGYNQAAMIYAANMLKQLLTFVAKLQHESKTEKDRFNPDKIQAFMLQNLDKPLDLETLANEAKLSKYHFSNKYKQATGYAPIQHLIHMKMEYARYLLETSDLNIQDIAYRVGYDDGLYFSRIFSKSLGLSPKKYRDKNYSLGNTSARKT